MVQLSAWEQFVIGLLISFLQFLSGKATATISLSVWEQIVVNAGLSFLNYLATVIKNVTESSAVEGVIGFLEGLISDGKIEADAIAAAISFLQRLLSGQVSTT